MLGTADYMSPEQADGRPVTARCDQYSLGGVMYALLAGRPPFRAKNLPEMLQLQRFAEPEPVRRYAPDTPEQLEARHRAAAGERAGRPFSEHAVLARHLQAMVMALSQPAHDSFSLAGEGGDLPPLSPGMESSIALAVTQAETELPRSATPPPKSLIDKDEPTGPDRKSPINVAETMPADDEPDRKPRSSAPISPAATVATAAVAAPRPSVFTTVEEDMARRQREHARSWGSILAPLVTLALALAALAGVGALPCPDRPPPTSSIKRFRATLTPIPSRQSAKSSAKSPTLSPVSRTMNARPRCANISNASSSTRSTASSSRHRGGVNDPALLPVEVLYLKAMSTAESSPETSIRMLESLIKLYGTSEKAADSDERPPDVRATCRAPA